MRFSTRFSFAFALVLSLAMSSCGDVGHDDVAVEAPTTTTTFVAASVDTLPQQYGLDNERADRYAAARDRDFVVWVTTAAESADADHETPAPVVEIGTPAAASYDGLGPCGGDLPPCSTKDTESSGHYDAVNPSGCNGRGCFGAWQFDPNTWAGVRAEHPELELPGHPSQATPEQQDAAARALWAGGAGCGHWDACN